MPKASAGATCMKRSKPIIAWLKKEHQEKQDNARYIDEISNKLLKLTSRVCLEPLDGNVIKNSGSVTADRTSEIINKRNINNSKKNVKSNKNQTQVQRRSARNLPPDQKPVTKPVEVELDLKNLPPILFKGHINYIHDFYDIANLCDKLLTEVQNSSETVVPIGFDLEWPFNFQTGSGKTALAQICLSEKECHLLHLYAVNKLPTSFIALLSHTKVKLVGVNIKNDVWKLTRDFKEFPGKKVVDNNCLDCGPHANSVLKRSCRWSLERLTTYMLNKTISKNPSVRNSRWHIHPLTDAQKLYAATDAYVSLLLHLTIEQKKIEILEKDLAKISEEEEEK